MKIDLGQNEIFLGGINVNVAKWVEFLLAALDIDIVETSFTT